MLKLICRNSTFLSGYKEYCQELYDHKILIFVRQIQNKLMRLGLKEPPIGILKGTGTYS